MSFRAFLVPFQALVSEPLYPGWGWMSQCRHALRQDIWQVMSLDELSIQYTQADEYSHEGYAHRLKEMGLDDIVWHHMFFFHWNVRIVRIHGLDCEISEIHMSH